MKRPFLRVLIGVVVGYLFLGQLLLVDGIPCIGDVGQHEGDEQADDGHGAQRELTAARVGYGQRRL